MDRRPSPSGYKAYQESLEIKLVAISNHSLCDLIKMARILGPVHAQWVVYYTPLHMIGSSAAYSHI